MRATRPLCSVIVLAVAALGCSADDEAVEDVESAASAPFGLTGTYFDDADLTVPKLSRVDGTVNFDWSTGSPDPTIGSDTFSVRWTGKVKPRFSQTYRFYVRADDGVRLWVNGVLVIDSWADQSAPTERSGTIALIANQASDLRLEYYERTGNALVQLSWSSASETKKIISQKRLSPASSSSGDVTPPTVPGSLAAANVTSSSISLSWQPSTDDVGVTGYEVSRDGAVVGTVNGTTYTDSGLQSSTPYTYTVRAGDAAGNASAASSPVSATTSSTGGGGLVSLEPVDGGPAYYGQFSNAIPTDPTYFPISTWLMTALDQGQIDIDKAAGLNFYVGVADPEGSNLSLLRTNGFKAFIQADERTRFAGFGTETAGWLLYDEIDMVLGPTACTTTLQTIKNGLPVDARIRFNNYGKGVLLWETDAEARCFIDAQDVVSADLYWFTDANQIGMWGTPWLPEGDGRTLTLSEVRRAANYGYAIDRMRALDALDGKRKPVWNVVEVGWPFTESAAQGGRAILPVELRAAVWHGIIAGARGLLYFNHQFGGSCTDSVVRDGCYPENLVMMKSVNQQVKDLAPVLNAPTVSSGWTASPSIRATVKWYSGHFYVLSGSRNNVSSTGTVSIPCVGTATAVRLGEGGSVAVSNGSFSDAFTDGNAIHIYRIDGGATCGLN